MKIKNVEVYGLLKSIVRSGYPMQTSEPKDLDEDFIITKDDAERALKLAKTANGSGHNNYLKGIIVQFDLQYPEYFSPQLQRYHWIDIISSQSKMHKVASRELVAKDFTEDTLFENIRQLNELIVRYNDFKRQHDPREKQWFNKIISNLPSGYLKWMGISTNYLQLKTIYSQRRSHKLADWQFFCNWIENLPNSQLITGK